MKSDKVWRDEYVEIKAYLSCHTQAETIRKFGRCQDIIRMINKSNDYHEFDKFRNNRRHWRVPVDKLPKPMSWYKKTPVERFNDEWYFDEEVKK